MDLLANARCARWSLGGYARRCSRTHRIELSVACSRRLARIEAAYVRLAVSDTGTKHPASGLPAASSIPFFTTKRVGEGTGRRLAARAWHRHRSRRRYRQWSRRSAKARRSRSGCRVSGETGETRRGTGHPTCPRPRRNGDDHRWRASAGVTRRETWPISATSRSASIRAARRCSPSRTDPQRFDAIVTDDAMPDITGTELARDIRRLRPNIPIVLMSGHGGARLARQAAASA